MKRMSIRELVVQSAIRHSVKPADIYGKDIKRTYSRPRQWVCCEARQLGYSLPLIGRVLGLHHTTVLHGAQAEAARRAVQG